MAIDQNKLIADLENILSTPSNSRIASLEMIAVAIRHSGNYRWVGLYAADHVAGVIKNIVWSGPGAPAHPRVFLCN